MRICFEGFEHPIPLKVGKVTTIEIENKTLFARVCQSLIVPSDARLEPFTLWNNDTQIASDKAFLNVASPLVLPYNSRAVVTALYGKIESMLLTDEQARAEIESLAATLFEHFENLALDMHSDYDFTLPWNVAKYLKAFSFGLAYDQGAPLIDKLIAFMALSRDIALDKWTVFTNLKLYLGKKDLETYFEQACFYSFSCILLENVHDGIRHDHESKYRVDQDLLEEYLPDQSQCPSSRSEDLTP